MSLCLSGMVRKVAKNVAVLGILIEMGAMLFGASHKVYFRNTIYPCFITKISVRDNLFVEKQYKMDCLVETTITILM